MRTSPDQHQSTALFCDFMVLFNRTVCLKTYYRTGQSLNSRGSTGRSILYFKLTFEYLNYFPLYQYSNKINASDSAFDLKQRYLRK